MIAGLWWWLATPIMLSRAPIDPNAKLQCVSYAPFRDTQTPLVPQAVLGSPYPPWRRIGEADVAHVLDEIAARGPRLVALSGHDSTPWTYGAFGRCFAERYRTLQVGEEVRVSAALLGQ